jgi:carbamoyl-phosphate synthase large subunit
MTRVATRVLVTGAGTGLGNNVIRSLRTGEPSLVVVGCHDDRFELKKSAADRHYLVPPARHRDFAAALRRVVAAAAIDLVVPTSDADVLAVSRARARLGARVFLPRHRVIELCQDKCAVSAFLRARGVPAPLTYPVRRLDGLAALFRRLGPAPRVWCRVRRGSGSLGATPVRSAAQARSWIAYWGDLRGIPARAFTLCEYLPGRDFGCQSLWRDGRLVLAKTFERLAYFAGESQPSGVSSVASLAKSVVEPRVVEVCAAAVRALDARTSGLYCIDLKENRAGVPCVTDVNVGRFSLTTGLYDLVGRHNTAATYVRLALGRPVDIAAPYDAAPDHYLVRDVDTLPEIVDADALFEGITDAR